VGFPAGVNAATHQPAAQPVSAFPLVAVALNSELSFRTGKNHLEHPETKGRLSGVRASSGTLTALVLASTQVGRACKALLAAVAHVTNKKSTNKNLSS
jgi:hypothetical protein